MIEQRTGRVRIARERGYDRFGVTDSIPRFETPLSDFANLVHMAEHLQPLVISRTRDDPTWVVTTMSQHIASWAGAPIIARGQLLGFLSLDNVVPGFYSQDMAERLAVFAAQAGLALENARLYAEQQKLATTDGLTGLANRRYFDVASCSGPSGTSARRR
jgi:GAF domain-containing protein